MKNSFLVIAFLFTFALNTTIQAQNKVEIKDKVVIIDDFESEYVIPRTVEIYFPKEYNENPTRNFPVLYMQDGQNLFDRRTAYGGVPWEIDQVARQSINKNEITPCIIVGISSVPARFHEYFPQKALVHLTKEDNILMEKARLERAEYKSEFLADNYLKFLVEELKPFIDKNYRTKSDASNTAIAGSSMGGLISLYGICEYPQVFGQAACISTHWPILFDNKFTAPAEAVRSYLKDHLPDPTNHRIYFDYGTLTLDQLYEVHQNKVDALMVKKGYTKGRNWETKKFQNAEHHEDSWGKRSDVILKFLFKK